MLGHERNAATAKLAQLPSGRRGRRSGEHKEEGRNFGGRGRKHMSAELVSANEEAKVSYECDCERGMHPAEAVRGSEPEYTTPPNNT